MFDRYFVGNHLFLVNEMIETEIEIKLDNNTVVPVVLYDLMYDPCNNKSIIKKQNLNYIQLSADIMRIVWLRTGSNPADIYRIRSQ